MQKTLELYDPLEELFGLYYQHIFWDDSHLQNSIRLSWISSLDLKSSFYILRPDVT